MTGSTNPTNSWTLFGSGQPMVNVTGIDSPDENDVKWNKWYGTGDNGFGNNRTINTWTGASNHYSIHSFDFIYDEANLEVIKTVDKNIVFVGDIITYSIKLKNLGISWATEVEVEDLLPTGLSYISHSIDDSHSHGSIYNPVTGVWSVVSGTNEFLPGQELTLNIVAEVTSATAITNTATVNRPAPGDNSPLEPDPDLTNNTSSVVVYGMLDPIVEQPNCDNNTLGSVQVQTSVTGATYTLTGILGTSYSETNSTGLFENLPLGDYSLTASLGGEPSSAFEFNINLNGWNLLDCDGDGVTNGDEVNDGTDPFDPCDLILASQTLSPNQDWIDGDCDGDGVTNDDEVNDATDPFDPCDYLAESQTLPTSQEWKNLDCDNDGIPNGEDPDPLDPCTPNPVSPDASILQQPDCDNPNGGVIEVNNPLPGAQYYYIYNSGGTSVGGDNGGVFSGLIPGNYVIYYVIQINGEDCKSSATEILTIVNDCPNIEITKEGDYDENTGKITFTFNVINTGYVPLSDVVVTDTLPGVSTPVYQSGDVNSNDLLDVGETWTYTSTYTVTQADIDAGGVWNIAFVDAKDPKDDPIDEESTDPDPLDPSDENYDSSCPDCTFTEIDQNPGISITKSGSYDSATGVITYTFTVVNTGNVTISNVDVTDPLSGISTPTYQSGDLNSDNLLDVDETWIYTATYTVTQADIDEGNIINTATVSGDDPNKDEVTDNSSTNTFITQNPGISITKTGVFNDENSDGFGDVGETITYTFTVENTGNVTISNVSVTDVLPGVIPAYQGGDVNSNTLLDVGETWTYTATYTLTQADIDAGKVENTAIVDGLDSNGDDVTDTDDEETVIDQDPSIDLTKSGVYVDVNNDGVVNAGDKITYTFTVVNTGNVTVSDIEVEDAMLTGSPFTITPSTLAPGQTGTVSVDYTLTQADIDAGEVQNTATATGEDPDGGEVPSTDTEDIDFSDDQDPSIDLTKSGVYVDVNSDGVVNVGDKITYTFSVENTGNVTVSDIEVEDAMLTGSPFTITPSTLAPGESGTVSIDYFLTQADIDAGEVLNTATATGTDTDGEDVTDTDNEDIDFSDDQDPSINLTKSGVYVDVNTDGVVNAGDKITYTFTVENTGNVTVSDIEVEDAMLTGSPFTISPSTLAPGQTGTVIVDYFLTQDDIDAGEVNNTATATGKDPENEDVPSTDTEDIDFSDDQDASIDLTKSGVYVDVNGDGIVNVGDKITYTFTVENTGNVTVSDIEVEDPMLTGSPFTITPSTLAPGESGTVSVDYFLTQDDIDAGEVQNTATATGEDPDGGEVPSTDTEDIDFSDDQDPSIDLTKSGVYVDVNGDGIVNVGDKITYTFTVENTGNVTVSDIEVEDPMLTGSPFTITPSTLAPGQTGTVEVDYFLTQADIDAGEVHNTATATGEDPEDEDVTSTDTEDIDFSDDQDPSINLTKSGVYVDVNNDGIVNVGDKITYTFIVENTGNVTVSDIEVEDAMLTGSPFTITPSTLEPGESGTVSVDYILTQDDIDAGEVLNTATATGKDPDNNGISDTDTEDTDLSSGQNPEITLTKAGVYNSSTDQITYTFTVVNTGNVTVSDIEVEDAMLTGSPFTITPSTLEPGESGTVSVDYILTQDDIDAGEVLNTATATGTDTDGEDVTDTDNEDIDFSDDQDASIDLTKSGVYDAEAGTITYTFTVENTGNVTITDVVVNDPMLSDDPIAVDPSTLAPGESATVTVVYEVTQDDLDAGTVHNVATVNGEDPDNTPVEGEDEEDTDLSEGQESELTLTKTGVYDVDDNEITYTFTVENTGTVTVTDIVINDPMLSDNPIAVDPSTLAPGESATVTVVYEVTQDDLDAGTVHNVATVDGKDPNNNPVEGEDEEDTDLTEGQESELTLTKTGVYDVDDNEITYTFTVENTGTVTVTDIVINDPMLSDDPIAVDPSTLAPGESATVTVVYEVTQEDLDAGTVHNVATVNGEDPDNTPVEGEDEEDTDISEGQESELTLTKTGVYNVDNNEITYTFTVENTGTVTITDIVINDPMLSDDPIEVDPSTLAPGESATVTVVYEVTQEDLDAGTVHNVATVNGEDPNNNPVEGEDEEDTDLTEGQDPSINLTKSGSYNADTGVITYTFVVTNTGNVTVSDIVVNDPMLGGDIHGPITLAPGDSETFTVDYTVTQEDIDAGGVYNIASAEGEDPNGDPVTDTSTDPEPLDPDDENFNEECPDCTFTPLDQDPSINITKSGSYNADTGVITYTFTVTNDGNTTLTDVIVNDEMLSDDPIYGPETLEPGQTVTFSVDYTVTQEDIDAGGVYNIASAEGEDPNGNPVTDTSTDPEPLDPEDENFNEECPDCTFTPLDQNSELTLWKSGEYVDANGDEKLNIGDVVEYTFIVENTGNTTVYDIYITDPLVTVNGGPITLAPGEIDSTTFTATYYLTEDDINALVVYNLATAEGEDLNGNPVVVDSKDPNPLDEDDDLFDPNCPDCTVTPLPEDEFDGIVVPDAFTPDGDGINDTWVIDGIEFFPDNEVVVYNRWGNIVYSAKGYLNDWDGTSNSNMNVGGSELPTGTYYYVLDTKDEKGGVIKGYVYIQR